MVQTIEALTWTNTLRVVAAIFGLNLLVWIPPAGTALAQSESSFHLNIDFGPSLELSTDDIEDICSHLVEYFHFEKNTWGAGVFDQVDCGPEKPSPRSKGKALWRVSISQKAQMLSVEIKFAVRGKWRSYSNYRIRQSSSQRLLEDKSTAQMLALAIRDRMPMFGRVDSLEKNTVIKLQDPMNQPVRPFESIALYQLQFHARKKIWQTRWLGEAVYSDVKKGWSIAERSSRGPVGRGPVFFHNSSGAGTIARTIKPMLEELEFSFFGKVTSTLKNSVASGYAGVRFGVPASIGAFYESRSGVLGGLRLYIDQFPENSSFSEKSALRKYQALKLSLGYGLGHWIEATGTRLEIVPRLGWQDFYSELRILDDEFGTLELNGALNMGLDINIEQDLASIILVRLTYGQDFALSGFADSDGSILVTRLGVDGFVKGPKISDFFNLGFMGFAFQDSIKYSKNDSLIQQTNFQLLYFGLGLTLAW